VDGVHDELGILLEIEAGRGARGNAVYRDLVRTSLIVPHASSGSLREEARSQLAAVIGQHLVGSVLALPSVRGREA
jgi:hypothetical protein